MILKRVMPMITPLFGIRQSCCRKSENTKHENSPNGKEALMPDDNVRYTDMQDDISKITMANCIEAKDRSTQKETKDTLTLTVTVTYASGKLMAVFNEAMNPSTINHTTFKVTQGAIPVAGHVTYADKTAMFTPTNTLLSNKTCTATITNGAKTITGVALAETKTWSFATRKTNKNIASVNLATASDYVILAKTAITNSATSAIIGDLGLYPEPTSKIDGLSLTEATEYATSKQVTGRVYAANMEAPTSNNLAKAVADMTNAYNDAAGRMSPNFVEHQAGNIGGKTLEAGLYKWTTSVTIASDLIIKGAPTDVWIFQIAGDMVMSESSKIELVGGVSAKNIFWQVAGDVTLKNKCHIEGVILCRSSITFQEGASLKGRALAQANVSMDANTIVKPE